MRQAGTLASEADARRFVDYLLTVGIESRSDCSGDECAIWIYDENQLARGRQELKLFRENPNHERYAAAAQVAVVVRKQTIQANRKVRKNWVDVREQWQGPQLRRQKVTYSLMVAAILVALITSLGGESPILDALLIRPVRELSPDSAGEKILPEVLRGQAWRLFTPALLHFGPLHLLFNLYWLYFLGGMIERRQGPWLLAAMVLVTALVSNLAQWYAVGPLFGGLSGVNAGLFGYVWIKSYLQPDAGYFMHPNTVVFMLATMLLQTTGALGPIANYCHGGGLVTGMAWAGLTSIVER